MLLWDDDEPFEELAAIDDAEELCRQLLATSGGWGSSTRHAEAVELLDNVHGSAELPASLIALLLCTCRRWHRVTAKLIVAIEDSGLLGDGDLDELSEWCLAYQHEIVCPLTWLSPEWLEVDLEAGTSETLAVDDDTLVRHRVRFEPPLRRWAASRVLRANPERLQELLRSADAFEPRHRDSLIHGLLDAAAGLDEAARRALVRRGLRAARAGVRRTALDLLCELDGPDKARRRATADASAAVRAWRPRSEPVRTPSLLDAA